MKLAISHFRRIAQADMITRKPVNILLGRNGAGKSSIIGAVTQTGWGVKAKVSTTCARWERQRRRSHSTSIPTRPSIRRSCDELSLRAGSP